MVQQIYSLDGQRNIESVLEPLIEESIKIGIEISKLKSEFDLLCDEYKTLILNIETEKTNIIQKKNQENVEKLIDSAAAIVKSFLDYAGRNTLSAFDTPHFFATQIKSEESYFLKKRVICLMLISKVLVVENESYRLIGGELIIPCSDS